MKKEDYRKRMAQEFVSLLKTDEEFVWKCGWLRTPHENGISHTHYKGTNKFMLAIISELAGWSDPRWFTFNQIFNRVKGKFVEDYYHKGTWKLKKRDDGEKQHPIPIEWWCWWSIKERRVVKIDELRRLTEQETDELELVLHANYYYVFNAEQIDGVPALPEPEEHENVELSEYVEAIRSGMDVKLTHGGQQAYYNDHDDSITLPEPKMFFNNYEYNSALLHELAHATGHEKRLDRPSLKHYLLERPKEELVAEITSAFLSVDLNPTQAQIDSHKGYVQGWYSLIEDDPGALYSCVKQAEKAAEYMEQYVSSCYNEEKAVEKMVS